jgi:hypothetical protein
MNYKSALITLLSLYLPVQAHGFNIDPIFVCLTSEYPEGTDRKYSYAQNSKGNYQDVPGDALEFIDLSKLKVTIDDDIITIKMSLTHIPDFLIYDRADIPDNAPEYEWAVFFDVDGDGTPANDISISISSFKFKRDKVGISRMTDFTQYDVWLSGSSLTSEIDVSIVDRSTLSLIVRKSSHKALARITAKTPIRFSTLYNYGGGVCEDFYPDIRKE